MSKRVFVSISLQRGTKHDQVTNVTNGLGYSKGIRVKGGRSVARGGEAEAGSDRGQIRHMWAMMSAEVHQCVEPHSGLPRATALLASPALNWGYGGLKGRHPEVVAHMLCTWIRLV